MNDPQIDIAAERAICDAATPGPWEAYHRCHGKTAADDESCGLGLELKGPPEATNRGWFARGADATFCAHVREAYPLALDRIEELEAALKSTLSDLHAARAERNSLRERCR